MLLVATIWAIDPLYSRYAIDTMLSARDGATVDYVRLFAIWGLIFVCHATFQSLNKYMTWRLDNRVILDRREDVFRHVLRLGVSFHTQQKSGEVVKILDEGADMLASLQRSLFIDLTPSFLTSIVFLIAGFILSPIMAGILLIGLALYLCVAFLGTRRTMPLQQSVNRLWVVSVGRAFDAVTNIFNVKSGAQEEEEMARMHRTHEEAFRKQEEVNRRWAFIEGINFFFLTRILLVSTGIFLYTKDLISLGEVYFFQSSFFRVLAPFEMLGGMLPQWNRQVGKVRLAQQILETPIDVANPPDAVTLPALQGAISFQDVSFSYRTDVRLLVEEEEKGAEEHPAIQPPPEEEPVRVLAPSKAKATTEPGALAYPDDEDRHPGEVLHGITLDIRPGEHIAFVGHSGAGKTTLAMLINRFYDVTGGALLVDGTDIRRLNLHWWRSQIGLVQQENVMFNDSILENIRYARPDATEEEVREAARRAAASEFIEGFPQKYHTVIGDRGIRLSGGQRQRVAIARAILKNPTIVVLDEATSALDSVTEKHVQEGIRELIAGRTSCIIAHRLSTVRSVDRIAVFDKGRLVDCAPHETLLRRCSIYTEMVELQSHGMLAEA